MTSTQSIADKQDMWSLKIKDFVVRNMLAKSWNEYPVSFTHVIEKERVTYTSMIDHFFWNKCASGFTEDAGMIRLPENVSLQSRTLC